MKDKPITKEEFDVVLKKHINESFKGLGDQLRDMGASLSKAIREFRDEIRGSEADWLYAHRDEIDTTWKIEKSKGGKLLSPAEIRKRNLRKRKL